LARVLAAGAAALRIDADGTVVAVDPLDGTKANPGKLAPIPLRALLVPEDAEAALEDVREVMRTGAARFVSWAVGENGASKVHSGWLYLEAGAVVGVLRCFEPVA